MTETCLIKSLTAAEAHGVHAKLCELLIDCVASGASVGFLPPLNEVSAQAYWDSVIDEVETGARILLTAICDDELTGSVQLELARKANATHRAEVQKLMVHTAWRGRRIAEQLINAIEAVALEKRRTLLVLDTKQGDTAERLYEKWSYRRAGVIPYYVQNENGGLDATVLFYKLLEA